MPALLQPLAPVLAMWSPPEDPQQVPDPPSARDSETARRLAEGAPHAGPRSLAKLLEAVISLSSQLELPSVLRAIVEAGVELTGARYGALGVLDERHTGLAEFITVGMDEETRRRIGPTPKGLGLLGALIDDARPLRVADVYDYPGRSGFPQHHPPMTSFLGVPIRIGDEVFGNLYLTDKREGEVFTDVDEELMLGLASAAGAVITNARLFDEVQRREAAISATHEVARLVLEGADPDQTLRFIAERARVLAKADLATFALADRGDDTLVMAVVDGAIGGDLAGVRFPMTGSVSGEVLRAGRTALFSDLSLQPLRVQPQVRAGSLGPGIFVPLTAADHPFGSLFVGRARGAPPFDEGEVEMVRSFASQAGIALDTATKRQELGRLSLLEEQERIGRDLHDTVIQQLFGVGLALQGLVGMERDQLVRTRLAGAVDDLDGVIRQIRTVIFDVQRTSLAPVTGLRRELLAVTREVSRPLGFEPSVLFDGPVDTLVDDGAAKAALATVREALSNVARHAQANQVEVTVVVAAQRLTIHVVDDGVGIPADRDHGGRGLHNMHTRAERLGGHLQVGPGADGSGTVVEWTVPLT